MSVRRAPLPAAQELLCRALIQGLSCPSLSTSLPPFLLSVPLIFKGNCLSCSPSEANHFFVESVDEFLKLCLSCIIFDACSLQHPRGCVMQAVVSLSGPGSPVAPTALSAAQSLPGFPSPFSS